LISTTFAIAIDWRDLRIRDDFKPISAPWSFQKVSFTIPFNRFPIVLAFAMSSKMCSFLFATDATNLALVSIGHAGLI
jgi:hypothetical protein